MKGLLTVRDQNCMVVDTTERVEFIETEMQRGRSVSRALAMLNEKTTLQAGQCPWCLSENVLDDRDHLGRSDNAIQCSVFGQLAEDKYVQRPRILAGLLPVS